MKQTNPSKMDWQEYPLVDLDALPRTSPWPARLLGLAPWQKRSKTEAELKREYETDFFSRHLAKARAEFGAATYRQWFDANTADLPPSPCLTEGGIRLIPPRQQLKIYIDLIEEALRPLLPASALVDLGAGSGKIPFSLAERGSLANTPVFALEYSASGRDFIRHFASNANLDLAVGECNFLSRPITPMRLPQNAVLITSMTICCIPQCGKQFLRTLLEIKPKAVMHFEPCYDLLDDNCLHHLMCRRYIELNDYNRTLYRALHSLEVEGLLRIRTVRPHVFGGNPLLPTSIFVWEPV